MTPPITRISQPVDDMARLAVKLLFEKIGRGDIPSSHILLTPNLISGGSISAPAYPDKP